MKRKL
jgi:hypothetical protein